jgi:hypothetical protein
VFLNIGISDFEFVSDFDIRISDLTSVCGRAALGESMVLRYLPLAFVAAALTSGTILSGQQVETPPDLLIGYTEHRTDLPGGRHANVKTRRAVVVKSDGTGPARAGRGADAPGGRLDGVWLVAGREGGPPEPLLEERRGG